VGRADALRRGTLARARAGRHGAAGFLADAGDGAALRADLLGVPPDGRLLNDVLPVRGHEQTQTGAGSTAALEFHVEDAFDDDRCDFLALPAVRIPDRIPTTLAGIEDVDLWTGRRSAH